MASSTEQFLIYFFVPCLLRDSEKRRIKHLHSDKVNYCLRTVVWGQVPRRGSPDFKWQGWSNGGKKSKPKKKSLGLQTKLKKSLDQNLTPKKSHAEFPSHKNFQKALNDTTRKIETLVFNTQKTPYFNILAKIFQPKKIQKSKIQSPKNPSIIPVTWNPEYPLPPWGQVKLYETYVSHREKKINRTLRVYP